MESHKQHQDISVPWLLPSNNASSFPGLLPFATYQLLQPSFPSPQPNPWFYLVLPVLTALVVLRQLVARPPVGRDSPKSWNAYDWPLVGSALPFFWRRRDMLVEGRGASTDGMFGFFVGTKHVVSIYGETGMKTFYESRNLNFSAGFTELLTGIPPAGNAAKRFAWLRYFIAGTKVEHRNWFKYFTRTIMDLASGKNLAKKLDVLTGDIRSMCDELAALEPSSSTTDWRVFQPFENVYELIYKLSFRMVGSTEFAEDRHRLRMAIPIYRSLEEDNSMTSIIFPWLITPGYLKKIYLAARLYLSFMDIIKARKSGQRQNDSTQYLLDRGDSPDDIVKAQIGAIWAAGLTTATTASWLTVLLSVNPEWKEKCRSEVDAIVSKHRKSTDQSPKDVLDGLTLQEWEYEFPLIDLCLRESIRVAVPGTLFRKNTSGASIPIGETGEVIPNGSFAAFLVDNVHMDPRLYPEPQKFNPGRYFGNALDEKRDSYAYVGWGRGRNPCLGMRMAKLEITLTLAYFLATFDFELSDKAGGFNLAVPPMPDRNGHKAQKTNIPIYLRYRLRRTGE